MNQNLVLKDPDDPRDRKFVASGAPVPTFKDLREFLIDIEDQKQTSSCTAHAGTSAYELLVKEFRPKQAKEFSRLFLYYMTRKLGGLEGQDRGAYTRDICKALEKWGVPPEDEYPFIPERINVAPPSYVIQSAKKHRIKAYARVVDIREAIADGFPVIIGAKIRKGLMGLNGPMNTHLDQLKNYRTSGFAGGHAMVIVGYDDTDASYIICNSWGTGWGDKGCFKMDRGMLHEDMMDAWAITGIKTWFDRMAADIKGWFG